MLATPGKRFRDAVAANSPLQIGGVINGYAARLATAAGFKALYVSGGGVAAASRGIPDLGMTSLEDVLIDVRRVTQATDLPVLVDIDTGWGDTVGMATTIRSMIEAGAAAVHLEDQVAQKRCGHRPGKRIVSTHEMVDRVNAAVNARTDPSFVIMARTDAIAVDGLPAAIDRASACVAAGADMIFPEAVSELDVYAQFRAAVGVPILANITEFGQTPLFTTAELASANVDMALYPLSAFRAMSAAALSVYQALIADGTQQHVIDRMQTRADLYEYLDYLRYEQAVDAGPRTDDNEATEEVTR